MRPTGSFHILDQDTHGKGLVMANDTFPDEVATLDQSTQRRRQFLVNPSFQWKYTFSLGALVFLITTCLSCVLYGLLHEQARQRMMNPAGQTASVGTVVLGFSLVFSILTSVSVGLWCFKVTHRICGPLYVIDRYLRELGKGVIPRLRPLRKKDEFKELFATFSKTMEFLRSQKQQNISVLNELFEKTRTMADLDDNARRDVLATMASQLDTLRKEVAQSLSQDPPESVECQAEQSESLDPVGVC